MAAKEKVLAVVLGGGFAGGTEIEVLAGHREGHSGTREKEKYNMPLYDP